MQAMMHTLAQPRATTAWQLPPLQHATQLQLMDDLLKPILRTNFPDYHGRLTAATIMDGKTGERAVIRYELLNADDSGPHLLFGKLYANHQRAEQVHQAMTWLWHEVFHQVREVGVPRPLGLLPTLDMVIYVPVEGQFLSELLSHEQADHWLALTATWLACLHQQPLPLAKHFDLTNELANLQGWARQIGQSYPTLFAPATHLVTFLQHEADQLLFQQQAPIHKDFHYQHVLVNGRLAVIDFDEMRLGDPNFDLAHFCANLALLTYRMPDLRARLPHLQATFLDTYQRHTGWVADRRFHYFFIYTCIKVAKQLCTERGPRPRPTGAEQQQQVQMILEEGVALVASSR